MLNSKVRVGAIGLLVAAAGFAGLDVELLGEAEVGDLGREVRRQKTEVRDRDFSSGF